MRFFVVREKISLREIHKVHSIETERNRLTNQTLMNGNRFGAEYDAKIHFARIQRRKL